MSRHPLLVLVAPAVAVKAIPGLHEPSGHLVEQLVTLALCSTVGCTWDGRSSAQRPLTAAHRRTPRPAEDAWISFVVRNNTLLASRGDSELHAGDEVLILASPNLRDELEATFTLPAPNNSAS